MVLSILAESMSTMRVVTANVNGIRAAERRGGLTWLAEQEPDVVAMQEVRATSKQFATALSGSALESFSLAHAESATAGREGVAIMTRHAMAEPITVIEGFDEVGRWVEADVTLDGHTVTIASVYVHTGEADTDKQVAKYRFLDAVETRMAQLVDRPAVVMGDFNIAHGPNDLKNWKGNRGKSGFLPDEQAYLTRFADAGWVDVVRAHHGDVAGPYTWWSWRGKAFDNDAGWRIDYQFASPVMAQVARNPRVGRADAYDARWSDHAAVVVDYALDAL